MQRRVLTLAFLRPDEGDPFLNRLTASMSEYPFCHVKLILGNDEGRPMGFSVQLGEVVTLRPTRLTNPGYQTLSIAVPTDRYQRIRRFCEDASARQYTFDNVGMYASMIHPGRCMHTPSAAVGATFCSKIVCEALQAGGVGEASGLSPSTCTPSRLYAAFKDCPSQIVAPVRVPTNMSM